MYPNRVPLRVPLRDSIGFIRRYKGPWGSF